MRSRNFASLLLIAGCGNFGPEDNIVCTAVYVFGLNVQPRDSISSAAIASGSSLVVLDGTYKDSVAVAANHPELDNIPLSSAGERAGNYQIVVRRPGYKDWVRANVQVTKDVCHVNPVAITALLQPAG